MAVSALLLAVSITIIAVNGLPQPIPGIGLLRGVGGNLVGNSQTQNTGDLIFGDDNDVFDLLNVNPQAIVGVNVLNSVTQTATGIVGDGLAGGALNQIGIGQIQNAGSSIIGDGNSIVDLIDVSPQVDVGVNLLNSVTQTATGAVGGIGKAGGPGNAIGTIQEIASGTNIKGAGNSVVDLIDVSPQVDLGVNLLNTVTQTATGAVGGIGNDGGAGNAIGTIQDIASGTNIKGAGNSVVDLIDVSPQVGVGVNLLNSVTQTATSAVGGVGKAGGPGNAIGAIQEIASGTNIKGAGNSVGDLIDVSPQVDLGVNLLNTVTQTATGVVGGIGNDGGAGNAIGTIQDIASGTNIKGAGNSVGDLIDVSPQVGVGVNLINSVTQTATGAVGGIAKAGGPGNAIGAIQEIASGTNIKGDGNSVVDLIDVSPQVDLGVNLLNTVTQTATGAVGGIGNAGGAGNAIGTIQDIASGTNIKGTGNSVVDLIDVSPQVGVGVNILNSVTQTATGAVGGIGNAGGAGNAIGTIQDIASGTNIKGDGNSVVDLIDVSPQVGVGINLLNSVTQTATGVAGGKPGGISGNKIGTSQIQNTGTNIVGSDNSVVDLLDVSPQANVGLNLLNTITQAGGHAPKNVDESAGNTIGTIQQKNNEANIVGSGNSLVDLINVNPQANVGLNLLNNVEQTATGLSGAKGNIIGSSQTQNSGTKIKGDNNSQFSLLNLNPQINVDANLLNTVKQTVSGDGIGGGLGHIGNAIGTTQTQNTGSNIKGSGNSVVDLLNVNPQANVGLNLLNTVTQTASGSASGKGLSGIGTVQEIDSGTNIKGDGNSKFSLLNVDPQINVDGNLLNTVTQTATGVAGGNLGGNRIGTVQSQNTPTNIVGNDNSIVDLLDVSPQANVGLNLLNSVSQTAGGIAGKPELEYGNIRNHIGTVQQIDSGTNIRGNGNSKFSLLNLDPQINVDANLLNSVTQTATGVAGGTLGGIGGNNIGSVQSQKAGTNIVGSGNSVVGLLDVNPQANVGLNLLNTVTQTAGGIAGIGNAGSAGNAIGVIQENQSGANIKGSGNSVVDLIGVNPQANVGLNLLNNVQQTALGGGSLGGITGLAGNTIGTSQQQNTGTGIVGDGNSITSLLNLSPQANVNANLLNSVSQTATGLAGGKLPGSAAGSGTNDIGSQQTQNSNVDIVGSNNNLFSLADIAPQIDLNIDLLNQLTQSATGAGGGKNHIGNTQTINDGVSIKGDNNKVSTLAEVKPQIAVDLQLLNQVKQVTGLLPNLLKPPGSDGGETLVDCENAIGTIQEHNSNTAIDGDGNTIFTGANISPQINVDLNLLNNVVQNIKCRPKPPKPTLPPPTRPPTLPPTIPPTRPPTRPPTVPPTLPPEECVDNEIIVSQQQNSGNSIVGDGNSVFSGVNVSPQLNLGVNALNNVVQRVTCKPRPPTEPPIQPPTEPPTEPPRRCFRRYCRKWRVKSKSECCTNCDTPFLYTTPKF